MKIKFFWTLGGEPIEDEEVILELNESSGMTLTRDPEQLSRLAYQLSQIEDAAPLVAVGPGSLEVSYVIIE